METITLPQGHVVLPFEICRRLGIEAGMRLEVEFDDKTGWIQLRPVNHKYAFGVQMGEKVKMKRKAQAKKRLK